MKPHLFGQIPLEEKPSKATAFEVATRLVLPVALVVVAQLQTQRGRFWGALGLAALTFLIGFFGPAVKQAARLYHNRRDRRRVAQFGPELTRLLERFSEFVSPQRNDTLEYLLQDACRGNQQALQTLALVKAGFFDESLYYARERLADGARSVKGFALSVSEFSMLVSNYIRSCVEPVFDRLPQEVRTSLQPAARRDLESFRERFVRFLDDYGEYLRRAERSFTTTSVRAPHFPRPKSLLAEG